MVKRLLWLANWKSRATWCWQPSWMVFLNKHVQVQVPSFNRHAQSKYRAICSLPDDETETGCLLLGYSIPIWTWTNQQGAPRLSFLASMRPVGVEAISDGSEHDCKKHRKYDDGHSGIETPIPWTAPMHMSWLRLEYSHMHSFDVEIPIAGDVPHDQTVGAPN